MPINLLIGQQLLICNGYKRADHKFSNHPVQKCHELTSLYICRACIQMKGRVRNPLELWAVVLYELVRDRIEHEPGVSHRGAFQPRSSRPPPPTLRLNPPRTETQRNQLFGDPEIKSINKNISQKLVRKETGRLVGWREYLI